MWVGHWDYFASFGVRGAAVASGRRGVGQGISRHPTSDSPHKDDLEVGEDGIICGSVGAGQAQFLLSHF